MAPDAGNAAYDAIVIGAGPAGGTAALMLARAGWSVALVEKRAFPRRKLCGEYVSATTLPVLRQLVGDAIADFAGPQVRRAAVFAGARELVFPMPKAREGDSWGRAVDRERLDALLLRAAAQAGAAVWQPWSASGLERRGRAWTCHLRRRGSARTIMAPLVIAANGSWERGAAAAGPVPPHRTDDLLAFKAHFTDCALPRDLMPLLAFPGGYGGMVHSGRGGVNLSCCIRRDTLASLRRRGPARAGEAVLAHIMGSTGGVRRVLRPARLDGDWLAAGPIRPGMRTLAGDGLFLAGNAAGEAHPVVAEGISMAIQSAWLLCRLLIARQEDLAAGRGLVEAGTDYAAAWRKRFAVRVRAADLFARIAMSPRAVGALVPLLERFPGLLALGAEVSGKRRQVFPGISPRPDP